MKVAFAAAAAGDLDEIVEYISKHDPVAAKAVLGKMLASVDLLRDNPRLGKPGRYAGTRELNVGRVPYVIIYVPGDDEVRIAAVLHTARPQSGYPSPDDDPRSRGLNVPGAAR